MKFNILIACRLVDVMPINELETYVASRIASRCDWKVFAQKVSVKQGRGHFVKKSDERQLLIICWYFFFHFFKNHIILILSLRTNSRRRLGNQNASQCSFKIGGKISHSLETGDDLYFFLKNFKKTYFF